MNFDKMSFENIDFLSIMNKLKFEENVDSFIPPIMFLMFGHVIIHKFSRLFVEYRFKGNITKWDQIIVELSLHMQIFCFWLLLVQLFQTVAQVCNSTITSCELKFTIRSIMVVTYLIVAFIPVGISLLECIKHSERIVVKCPIPTELGVEGMILSASHRHIKEVKRPLAYKLNRSISSFMLREFESVKPMHRSKSVNEFDKMQH